MGLARNTVMGFIDWPDVKTCVAPLEAQKRRSGANSRQFGSDFGGPPGCNSDLWLYNSDFWPIIDSAQTGYIVKGEAQKSPLFWRFALVLQEFQYNTLKFNKPPIYTNTPSKSTCLYISSSLRTADATLTFGPNQMLSLKNRPRIINQEFYRKGFLNLPRACVFCLQIAAGDAGWCPTQGLTDHAPGAAHGKERCSRSDLSESIWHQQCIPA